MLWLRRTPGDRYQGDQARRKAHQTNQVLKRALMTEVEESWQCCTTRLSVLSKVTDRSLDNANRRRSRHQEPCVSRTATRTNPLATNIKC